MNHTIHSVQFLRFVAAAMVVYYHAVNALKRNFPESVSDALSYFSGFGAAGVHLFFVISGFVMVYATFANGRQIPAGEFFRRRIVRIYPIYFVYSAFYLAFAYFASDGFSRSIFEVAGSLLLVPGYSSFVIGPAWTLSYEMYFYCCFALSLLAGFPKGLFLLTSFYVASIIVGIAMRPTEPLWHVLTNPLLLEFLCGTWLGYVAITTRRSQVLLAAGMVLLGLGCFALGIAWGYSRLPSVVMWGLPSALLLGGVVFLERNGWIPALIKRWSILGDSSYSLYLLHMLLMDIQIFIFLRLFEPGPITALAAAGCLSVVSIVVAAIAYRVLEQPLVSRLRNASRWSKGKPIADVS